MKAPISWLEDYVKINLPLKDLMWRMTEVGLTTESFDEIGKEIVLDAEVTPNRPDWMSVIGIAREIAAIQDTSLKLPLINNPLPKTANLPFKIKNDFNLAPRYTAITVKDVSQKPSPQWMQDRLITVGLRPINNLVDITNYVMFETGNPIHVFDYNKLHNGEMTIMKSKGGEKFVSVDEKSYSLPENAIIFKSRDEVVDLCGIKGGLNSGINPDTKNILILVAVYNGQLIRRTSQRMGLSSEASRIFERGANLGGTVDTLKRTCNLIQEFAGGETASDLIDVRKEEIVPLKLTLNLSRLEKILGITIPKDKVQSILKRLSLSPVLKSTSVECSIPLYRNDLRIEEDLIEEVARLYGYNNFPKTLPFGEIPVQVIPYFKDYTIEQKIKNFFTAAGYSEVQTYSLISESDLKQVEINSEDVLRVDNPVSREFEYLRPNLKSNLIKAVIENKPNFEEINLFEIGKIYLGKNIKLANEEYEVAGITNEKNYFKIKGLLERIFSDFHVNENPEKYIESLPEGVYFSFPYSLLITYSKNFKKFISVPKYPAIIEDMSFIVPTEERVGNIIKIIKSQSLLIKNIELFDKYESTRTFRITYQHPDKNLTTKEVAPIREKIIKKLKEKSLKLK